MQELLSEQGVSTVVGHMCRQGMRLRSPDGRVLPVRKATRWASSASEVLKRLGLRCTNEGRKPGDQGWHDHVVLEGRLPGGQLRTQAAAHYPPGAVHQYPSGGCGPTLPRRMVTAVARQEAAGGRQGSL